jgi:hypothetical protein
VLAKELKDDAVRAFCKGGEVYLTRFFKSRIYSSHQLIAVWVVKCVGYNFKFEKNLACLLGTMESSFSLSESAGWCKAATRNDDAMSEDEDDGKGADSESSGSSPPTRQQIGKARAKLVKYDWPDVRFQGHS